MKFLGKYKILKNNITVCDPDFILNEIKKRIEVQKNLLISPIASYTLILATLEKKLEGTLNNFDYLLPDGLWVKKTIHFLYGVRGIERIRGSDLLLKVCNLVQKNRYKIFLYGTTDATLQRLKTTLKKLFPKINIVGVMPSRFRELSSRDKAELINHIEKLRVNILFVALGSPRQEFFAYDILYGKPHFKRAIIVIPVGAAFDFISGVKPQAPEWIQNSGFEWLFRLICEPRRLWKRYLIYGPLFIFLVLFQKIGLLLNLPNGVVGEGERRR